MVLLVLRALPAQRVRKDQRGRSVLPALRGLLVNAGRQVPLASKVLLDRRGRPAREARKAKPRLAESTCVAWWVACLSLPPDLIQGVGFPWHANVAHQ